MFRSFFPIARRLLMLLACASALTARPAHAAPRNLLPNPGFEDVLAGHEWMPSGWDTSASGLPSVFFGRDTLLRHGGRYAVSVANASNLYPLAHNWSQTLLVGPEVWGKDMVFSVWTRSVGIEGRAYIKLEVYRDTVSKMARTWKIDRKTAMQRLEIAPVDDPIIDLGWKRSFFDDPETDWVRREVRVFVPPSVNAVFVRCGVFGTGQLFLDDASLTVESALSAPDVPMHTNLLSDPGFEGDGLAWEFSLPPYPGMRADVDTTWAHSGKASLLMSSPPVGMVPGKAGASQVLSNRNLGGKRMRLSGFIKADSLGSGAFLNIYAHTLRGVVQDASVGVVSGTMDWTPATMEMDLPPDTYEVWVWFTYTAPTRGQVRFDDASFEVVGKAGAHKN